MSEEMKDKNVEAENEAVKEQKIISGGYKLSP